MSTVRNDRVPTWGKYAIATIVGAGAVTGGQKLVTDSPVHFAVEGALPADAGGWKCEPEGGLIGAPMVCRPAGEEIVTSTSTSTDAR